MDLLQTTELGLFSLLSFIVVISVLVSIHEFGHYLVARLSGVKVEVFSIGFGKELWGFTDRSGTRWKIAMLPLGGYVKMFGDSNAMSMPDAALSSMTEEERKQSFHFAKLPQKMAIVTAGPFANWILAVAILTSFFLIYGSVSIPPIVGGVLQDSPAAKAGLHINDRVVSIDGEEIDDFLSMRRVVSMNAGSPLEFIIDRSGKQLTFNITPVLVEVDDGLGNKIKVAQLGVSRSENMTVKKLNIGESVVMAMKDTYYIATGTFIGIGQIITGKRGVESLGGPIKIAKLSGQAGTLGLQALLSLMAQLSVVLAVINMLPIPALDGGHLLYYIIEAFRGRPMALKYQELGFKIGALLLISLMVFSILNDIIHW